jgi:hypothetical protein
MLRLYLGLPVPHSGLIRPRYVETIASWAVVGCLVIQDHRGGIRNRSASLPVSRDLHSIAKVCTRALRWDFSVQEMERLDQIVRRVCSSTG